jgi:trigger factor
MKLKSIEKTEANTAVLYIEVGADEFEEGINESYKKNRHEITVQGFRKGRAPRKVIEAVYGPSVFYEDAINFTYPKAYAEAVVEAGIEPVDRPHVEIDSFPTAEGYTFKATVTVYPEVKLGEYKGLKASKKAREVTDEDIDAEIERLRERNSRLQTAEREARDGDVAIIDFQGFHEGEPFEGGKAEKYNLTLGSGSFIPGFEEQVVGLKAGEEKDVNVTFPEDFSEKFGGKDVVFKVKLHEVKEKLLPEVDDEFAKDVSEFDTLEEMRADLKDKMTKAREKEADNAFMNSIMEQLIESTQVELPKVLVDNQIDMMVREQEMMMQQQGLTLEEYAEMVGQTVEQIRESARPVAERIVKLELALNRVAELENIEVSEDEVEEEIGKMAEMYNMEKEQIKKYVRPEDMIPELRRRKAEKLIRENAVIIAEEQAEKEADEETGEKTE